MSRRPIRRADLPLAGVAGDLGGDEPEVVAEETQPILPSDLPLAEQAPPPASEQPSAPPNPAAPAEPAELVLSIDVPLAMDAISEFTIHFDGRLTVQQATTARRLAIALDRRGAKLANGQRVTTPGQAVRYLLEALAP